jgi:hypothetical protein
MKKRFIQIFAVLSFILPLATIAGAQINKQTQFDIPYDFVVGDKVLPAGEYIVRGANDQRTAWVIAEKGGKRKTVFLLAGTVDSARMNEAKMTFRQYGDRYFLAGFTVSDFRVTLSKTAEERFLQREFLANNKPVKTEIITTKSILQTK